MGLQEMIRFTNEKGVQTQLLIYGHALIHRARNEAFTGFSPEATHALFVDDDMLPQPDSLIRLLDADKPVITALCTTRGPRAIMIASKVYDQRLDKFGSLARVNRARVITGQFAPGFAFLLIDRPTIEVLTEYHLSGMDWLHENTAMLNRMAVRADRREAERKHLETIRRQRFKNSRRLRLFDFPVTDDDEELGEDVGIGRKLLRLGIPVSIDGTTPVGHMGEHPWGPWDLENQEQVAMLA
jgi:hypothetical protein